MSIDLAVDIQRFGVVIVLGPVFLAVVILAMIIFALRRYYGRDEYILITLETASFRLNDGSVLHEITLRVPEDDLMGDHPVDAICSTFSELHPDSGVLLSRPTLKQHLGGLRKHAQKFSSSKRSYRIKEFSTIPNSGEKLTPQKIGELKAA